MGLIEFGYLVATLLVGLFATIGYGVMSLTPADFTVARRCFWAASLLFAGIGIVWGITTPESVWIRFPVICLVAGMSIGGLTEAMRWVKTRQMSIQAGSQAKVAEPIPAFPSAPINESGILLDVAFELLPRISPTDGIIHIFEIRQDQTGIQASPIAYQFDPNTMIDWRRSFPDWPLFGIAKCEITSTTNEPVFYALIPVNLIFREMIPDKPGLPPVEIGGVVQSINGMQMRSGRVMMMQHSEFRVDRINPQNSYVIYFVNRTKYLVDIEVPLEGKVQDFSKTGADFEAKLNMKLGRTTGLHLVPSPTAF